MARLTVDPEHWQRVETMLDDALELAPENRPAFLDQACAGDPELRAELEALLAADAQTGGPLEAPLGNLVARLLREDRCEAPAGAEGSQAIRSDSPTSSMMQEMPQPADGAGERFLPGTMLADRYRIVSVLGRGGMGEVFRADDLKLEVPVALKFLPAELAADQERLSLLLNEVRLARQISHPHVCRVFDVGEVEGLHFISMEYIDGEDLATLLRRIGRLPSEKAVEIARGICGGLEAVHDQGILHRDLKPANLMIDDRGRVRITDFGVAAVAERVRGTAVRRGTPAYMAPEVRAGREASVQSDLYALGLVLYELFTGRPALVADTREERARLYREAPPPPSRLVDGLDPGIEQVILRCLEKDPHLRPASAQAVAAALPGRGALAAGTVLQTLLANALVGGTRLVERLGDAAAAKLFADHDRLARGLLAEHGGRELEKSGAGFLLLFARPIHAVLYAQAYHEALRELAPATGSELTARVGIHLGELVLRRSSSEDAAEASPLIAEGLAKATVTRLMSLAGGRQTLLTRAAFDVARRSAVGEIAGAGQLRWLAHGKYLLRELAEPVEVFEVGTEGLAPLEPPASTEEATRVPGEDMVLGWRPAPGLALPGRAHWTVEQKLGAGGFGEVWLAVHRKTGERRVFKFCYEASRLRALRREITLFRLLREELGERDDIARILDWNFEEAPFFIESEYTVGGNLGEWAEEQGGLASVPLAVRLELVAQVAEALAAAHSVGVLHKDVKPSNVLIYRDPEGRPRARLTDFGVGGVTEHRRLAAAGFTIMGFTERTETTPSSFTGTRLYMAPEILEGKTATLQADVYALGVVLYQVVAGDLTRALAPGWDRDVDDELLREDVAAAVDGVPERRLANALELATRLRSLDERRAQREAERRLREEGERAKAALERARRRRRAMAAAIAVLVLFAGAMGLLALRIRREAERAEREAARAKDFARVAVAESWITKDPTRAALVLLEVEQPDEIAMAVPAIRKVLQHRLAMLEFSHQLGVWTATWSPSGKRIASASFDNTVRVWNADGRGKSIVLEDNAAPFAPVSFSPSGDRVATCSEDATVKVWNADGSGEPIILGRLTDTRGLMFIGWSPDGSHIVAGPDSGVRVWNVDGQGEPVILNDPTDVVRAASWSPDSVHIATLSADGTARIWNADGRGHAIVLESRIPARKPSYFHIAWSPGGAHIATCSGPTVRIWNVDGPDLQPDREPIILEQQWLSAVPWSPDGQWILTDSQGDPFSRSIGRIWNIGSWSTDGRDDPIALDGRAVWGPNGHRVAIFSGSRTVQIRSIGASGIRPAEPIVLKGHQGIVNSARFSPSGERAVTGSADRTIRVWNVGSPNRGKRRSANSEDRPVEEPIVLEGAAAAWGPQGDCIVTASQDGRVEVWSINDMGVTADPITLASGDADTEAWPSTPSFDATGDRVLISISFSNDRKAVWVWNVDSSGQPMVFESQFSIWFSLFVGGLDPGGERIVNVSEDGILKVWNVGGRPAYGSGKPIILGGSQGSVFSVAAWSPDGERIVTGSEDGILRVWDVPMRPAAGSVEPIVIEGQGGPIIDISWSPRGDRIVSSSGDRTVRVWNVAGSGEPTVLEGHTSRFVTTASWSPSGDRIVIASADGTARIWNVDGSGEPIIFEGHQLGVTEASWSPTGDRVVTASWDCTARVWRADGSGEPIVLEGHDGAVGVASFSPAGDRVLTVSREDHTVRIWRLDTDELIGLIRTATQVCLDPAFREIYLDEEPTEAWQRYAACERSHGRIPVVEE